MTVACQFYLLPHRLQLVAFVYCSTLDMRARVRIYMNIHAVCCNCEGFLYLCFHSIFLKFSLKLISRVYRGTFINQNRS